MSIQLIVFPQSYEGQYNVISAGSSNNLLADAQLFTTATGPTGNIGPVFDFMVLGLFSSPNSWTRFVTTGQTAPTVQAGNLNLEVVVTSAGVGVYQTVNGLTSGVIYTLTITTENSGVPSGNIRFAATDGSTIVQQGTALGSVATATMNFTATNSTMNIIVCYGSTISDGTCTIDYITLVPSGTTPTFNTTELTDGQVILDLYADETIPLTLSIDDFKNAAEKVQSYSKGFKVPATKRNNRIFDNIFNLTRADDGIIFNPYVRTQSLLKQDGFTLFEGYLRLIDMTDKNGEVSYNINLYSEAVALADVLGDLTLGDLDFDELKHEYNKTNIKNSWYNFPSTGIAYLNPSQSGFRNVNDTIKYPFVDWNHQMTIADGSGTAAANMPELASFEQAFRPWIQIKYLIDMIFNQNLGLNPFPFSYTSDFFDTPDFAKLYMDFNWGDSGAPIVFDTSSPSVTFSNNYVGGPHNVEFQGIPSTHFGYDNSTGVFTCPNDNQDYTFQTNVDFEDTSFLPNPRLFVEWVHTSASGTVTSHSPVTSPTFSSWTYSTAVSLTGANSMNAGDTMELQFTEINGGTATVKVPSQINPVIVTTALNQMTQESLLRTLRGELGQWEFLKGIMTMFNLVTIPNKSDPNNILIEPYPTVFINNTAGTSLVDRGIAHDWTDKIDITQIKLKPLTDLDKKTIFKFVEDDDDYAFMNYKNSVGGFLYGSKVYDASGFTILDGIKEIVAEPFAATVIKPLMSQFGELVTPAIYSYNSDDGTSEGFDNSPRIMYNNGVVDLVNMTYFIPAQNGTSNEDATKFLQFSHLTDIPTIAGTTKDFHFGPCQLIPPGVISVTDNLFSEYWQPYFAELYNPNTRTMSLKVNLKPGDISKFNMYDTVFIKNRQFRVNKIDYKPNDLATVEFILVP